MDQDSTANRNNIAGNLIGSIVVQDLPAAPLFILNSAPHRVGFWTIVRRFLYVSDIPGSEITDPGHGADPQFRSGRHCERTDNATKEA